MNLSIRKTKIMKKHQNYRSARLTKQANIIRYELADYSDFSAKFYFLRDTHENYGKQASALRYGLGMLCVRHTLCDVIWHTQSSIIQYHTYVYEQPF